jgi:hypothetical protein
MEISLFFILAIVVYGASLYLAYKKKFIGFQITLIVVLLVIWAILGQIKAFIAGKVIFEEIGLVKALLIQVMDQLFFNMVAPLTALLVSISKKPKSKAK